MAGETESGRWIVWGEGEPVPHEFFDEEVPGEAAFAEIAQRDVSWHELPNRWAIVVGATEHELDRWAAGNANVRGFAPYASERPAGDATKVEDPRPY